MRQPVLQQPHKYAHRDVIPTSLPKPKQHLRFPYPELSLARNPLNVTNILKSQTPFTDIFEIMKLKLTQLRSTGEMKSDRNYKRKRYFIKE